MIRYRPKRQPPITILDAIQDEHLFAPWFRKTETWAAWRAFLAALFALPMTDSQFVLYQQCTGRTELPSEPATEAWLVIGRRGGKSFILALIAVFLACFHDYRQYLTRGERGTIIVVAVNRAQARVIVRYIRGLLHEVPMLKRMVERETAEAFDLSNFITIEVHTASFRSTRGYTVVGALLDELCDVFGSYSPGARVKLDEVCKIIGLPGKPSGINGSEVEAMVAAGRIAEVSQYCESDVLNTYRPLARVRAVPRRHHP